MNIFVLPFNIVLFSFYLGGGGGGGGMESCLCCL